MRGVQAPRAVPTLTKVGPVRRGTVYHLSTPKRTLEIFVSEQGNAIRVWDEKAKRELK